MSEWIIRGLRLDTSLAGEVCERWDALRWDEDGPKAQLVMTLPPNSKDRADGARQLRQYIAAEDPSPEIIANDGRFANPFGVIPSDILDAGEFIALMT